MNSLCRMGLKCFSINLVNVFPFSTSTTLKCVYVYQVSATCQNGTLHKNTYGSFNTTEGVVYTCWRLTNCIPGDHVLQDPYLPSKRCDNYLQIMPAVSQFCHLTYCSATEKDTSLTLSFVVRCTSEHEYSLWRRLNWHQVYLNTSNACAISE